MAQNIVQRDRRLEDATRILMQHIEAAMGGGVDELTRNQVNRIGEIIYQFLSEWDSHRNNVINALEKSLLDLITVQANPPMAVRVGKLDNQQEGAKDAKG